MDDALADRIHALWDELADFDAAHSDAALNHLLATLCELVDAQNANWFGAVRMADILPGDPVRGWRPRCIHFLRPSALLEVSGKEQTRNLEQGSVDETTIRNVALAGTFRANRIVDLVSEEWFQSDYYRRHYQPFGHADIIWAGVPVNADAECYFGVFRNNEHPRFSAEERDTIAYALRGLKWFLRQLMLSHGLLVAATPLTPTERRVLHLLLTGLAEKSVAEELGRSYHTVHECVTAIFRKFGVNNRAALMALWLGRAS